ncbi:DUF3592 domain-containing protein [Alkalimarinus coralli]|uniref:DUF3592 domain-containing protein n=1 Tax=Alkalimarinus coralli TaxID=2935863 RepID=UPI00202B1A8A|nr:DUF3592 domain-containing protein [Alkalimarinus coralli]
MDVFILAMGLTLLAAGWFLTRDYVRFLSSGYTVRGAVVSMQHAFLHRYSGLQQRLASPSLNLYASQLSAHRSSQYGIYPVVQYFSNGEPVRFTMIDCEKPGQYHVGETLELRFSRSRRHHNRVGRPTMMLILMLTALISGLMAGAMFSEVGLSFAHICFASLILTFCLFIIGAYYRCQDDCCQEQDKRGRNGRARLLISEPSSFSHWSSMVDDVRQRRRILGFQLCGVGCFVCGLVVVVAAFLFDITYASYGQHLQLTNSQPESLAINY